MYSNMQSIKRIKLLNKMLLHYETAEKRRAQSEWKEQKRNHHRRLQNSTQRVRHTHAHRMHNPIVGESKHIIPK